MSDTRIFVVGSLGQLGSDLMDILPAPAGADLPDLDITDPASVSSVLGAQAPGVIVNCAAFTNVDACETEVEAATRVNVDGPRNLAAYAEANEARLIHVSTDYVFDGRREVPNPYLEEDEPKPGSAYGRTKLSGEQAAANALARLMIVRTAWLYGHNGHNFLKTILRAALKNPSRTLTVIDDQHGCPTWSRRLAEQIQTVIESGSPGIYHATGEGHCTWYALAKTFLELMQIPHAISPCTTEEYPLPAARPTNSILENQRLTQQGLNRMRPWQEDLQEFVSAYRDGLIAEVGG